MSAVAVFLTALVAAACGSSERIVTRGATRSIVDAQGHRVRVPAHPLRVIALSEPTLDGALALGVRPIATTDGRGQSALPAYLASRTRGITSVGILGEPNLERVAQLRPDLILTDGTAIQSSSVLGKLREIAPTVYVSRTGENWRTAFIAEADLLGRAAQGRRLLAQFDRHVAAVRARLDANARATVSVVRWSGIGLPDVIPEGLATGRTLTALGLRRPADQREQGPGHAIPISLEDLSGLNADWMFFASLGEGGPSAGTKSGAATVAASDRALQLAKSTPGFTALPVYRRRHVVAVDGSAWTSAGGLLAEDVVVDDIARTLDRGGR